MPDSKFVLPYFHEATKQFSSASMRRIKELTRSDGMLSQVKSHTVFEGRKTVITQPDQTARASEMQAMSAELNASLEDLNKLDRSYIEKSINHLASQFSKSMSVRLFDLMNEVTAETGNTFDASGQKLGHDLILELLKKMPALSDPEDGEGIVWVVHPDMMPRIKELDEEFRNSPSLQRKFAKHQEEKIEEFRSDQLARKLAG